MFIAFAIPVKLKGDKEAKERDATRVDSDSDEDYDEDFDEARDPNADMMFYIRNQQIKANIQDEMPSFLTEMDEVDADADPLKSHLNDGFEELVDEIENDEEIDKFTGRMSNRWGEEESQLRIAVFVSFINNADKF